MRWGCTEMCIRDSRNSVCLSADVTAAYDPSWASAFEKQNGTYAGRGIAIFKYTGSRGKMCIRDRPCPACTSAR